MPAAPTPEEIEAFKQSPEFEQQWRRALMGVIHDGRHTFAPDPKVHGLSSISFGFSGGGFRYNVVLTCRPDNVIPFPAKK